MCTAHWNRNIIYHPNHTLSSHDFISWSLNTLYLHSVKTVFTRTAKFPAKLCRCATWFGFVLVPSFPSRNVRKRTFWDERQTKTQLSLRIRTVSLESSLSAWRNFASLAIGNAPTEDSDQPARMRRLISFFAGRTCPKVRFLPLRSIFVLSSHYIT